MATQPRLIEPGRLTVPEFLRQHGYRTACVGKWHLGMDWPLKEGNRSGKIVTGWEVDYAGPIANGPMAVGFDDYFGISASLDMPPYVFIEGDRPVGIPTVEKTWVRKGPAGAGLRGCRSPPGPRPLGDFVHRQNPRRGSGQASRSSCIFPCPRLTHADLAHARVARKIRAEHIRRLRHAGRPGRRADSRSRWKRTGLAGETLVIFTSDNGCSPQANFPELLAKGHDPSAGFRGTKADIFEGGHRVPLIVRWPGKVKPGTTSDQVVCLTDLFATCAEILGSRLPDTAAEDSVSLLPALLGTATGPFATPSFTIRSTARSRSGKGVGSSRSALTRAVGALLGPAATT